MDAGPAGHVRAAHALLAGQVGQGPSADDVLLEEPGPFDGHAELAALEASDRDVVFAGKIGQQSAGEAGHIGDLLE
jgi:hypothetical protein